MKSLIFRTIKNKVLNNLFGLFVFFSILLISGCSADLHSFFTNSKSVNRNQIVNTEFEKNYRLWQEKKISNYDFNCLQISGGMYSWAKVLIQVRNSQAELIRPIGEIGELEKLDGYEEIDTFEKIFNKIQESYEKKYIVEATYNKEYGYPEKVNINPKKDSHSALSIEINNFEIVDDAK